jgi:ssDNA-binding Zn-finger/Zn-ribbon topoisomerase 1
MIQSKNLAKFHAAAKMIEADACQGIRTCTNKYGEDIAGALLIGYLRAQLGSLERWPADPEIDKKVNDILKQEGVIAEEKSYCEDCGEPLRIFMKDMDGTNLEEVFGCPKCDEVKNEEEN